MTFAGNLLTKTDQAGRVTNFCYDNADRLTSTIDPAQKSTAYEYNARSQMTAVVDAINQRYEFVYDPLGRVTQNKKGTATMSFVYDAAGNRSQRTDYNGAVTNYSYDSLDRLTAATHPNQANESYTYDDVGNRTASHQGSSYSYQTFNRLVSANGTSFSYDTNGNQISKSDGNGNWGYSWDHENRLKQASLSGGVTVSYSYDALGRRVQQTSSTSGTERFVYDGADVVRDLDGSNAIVVDYLNGPGIDNKLRQTTTPTTSYFITDHLGTTRGLTDSAGSISSILQYDAFGNLGSGSSTRYTFTGREADAEIGLMYYRARWYSSQQGRFLSEDPIGQGGGINLYSYVDNSSINFTDPSGLERLQRYHMRITPPTDCGCSNTEILGHSAHFVAGFGDLISREIAELAAQLANHQSGAHTVIPPGWSPTGYIRGMTPGGAVVDPASNSYFAGQAAGVIWGMAMAVAGAAESPKSSGLGDLTITEVSHIQRVVDTAGRPLEVVGSAARCARTASSDIDYLVPHGSLPYYESFGLQNNLPRIDSGGLIPGVHNPYMGPAIRFEPGTAPVHVPARVK